MITYAYDGLLRLTDAVESPGTAFTYAYDFARNEPLSAPHSPDSRAPGL